MIKNLHHPLSCCGVVIDDEAPVHCQKVQAILEIHISMVLIHLTCTKLFWRENGTQDTPGWLVLLWTRSRISQLSWLVLIETHQDACISALGTAWHPGFFFPLLIFVVGDHSSSLQPKLTPSWPGTKSGHRILNTSGMVGHPTVLSLRMQRVGKWAEVAGWDINYINCQYAGHPILWEPWKNQCDFKRNHCNSHRKTLLVEFRCWTLWSVRSSKI